MSGACAEGAPPLETYFRSVAAVDEVEATRVVLGLLDEGTPVRAIAAEVLAPAQVRVGQLWAQGRWSVADEHAATAITETALSALSAASRRPHQPGRHVLVVCAEGEWHTLPARMVAAVAASQGLQVTLLGPSAPADQVERRLLAGDVDLLALSCTQAPNLLGAARCVQAAHRAGVPVLAGGQAFGSTARRAHAIGADVWGLTPDALTSAPLHLTGQDVQVLDEAVLLDKTGEETVAVAGDRLRELQPGSRPGGWPDGQDLRWIARSAGAAVLTDDAGVLDELLHWLCSLAQERPAEDRASTVVASVGVVADAVQPYAPHGAQLLREAGHRLRGAPA